MTFKTVLFAAAMTLPTANFANSLDYHPDPKLRVNAVDADSFEVIERRGAGAPDMWCAAARYANKALGVYDGRIWLETARGPSRTVAGSKGATFTIAAVNGDFKALSPSVRKAGQTLRISQARRFCLAYVPSKF